MTNENINELELMELTDEMLEDVAGGKKVIATGKVKVRSGPGKDFRTIGYLEEGDALTYDGATERDDRGVKWYRVRYRGDFGWVSSRYSKKK